MLIDGRVAATWVLAGDVLDITPLRRVTRAERSATVGSWLSPTGRRPPHHLAPPMTRLCAVIAWAVVDAQRGGSYAARGLLDHTFVQG